MTTTHARDHYHSTQIDIKNYKPSHPLNGARAEGMDHLPVPVDPRQALIRQVERAAAMGYQVQVGTELEFYLLDPQTNLPKDQGIGVYGLDRAAELARIRAPRHHVGQIAERRRDDVRRASPAVADRVDRARALDLQASLFYAVHFTAALLGTRFPERFLSELQSVQPNSIRKLIMGGCLTAAFIPKHPTTNSITADLARWLLYVRGHYIRMPVHLLIPHLIRKSFEGKKDDVLQSIVQTADGHFVLAGYSASFNAKSTA